MSDFAEIIYDGKSYQLPVVEGSEGEKAIDISKLRGASGLITIDKGFKKVVSNQGLTWLKTCSVDDPEFGLTDEEKDILGTDKVKGSACYCHILSMCKAG